MIERVDADFCVCLCWVAALFIGFCVLFGILVLVTWMSGMRSDFRPCRESLSKLEKSSSMSLSKLGTELLVTCLGFGALEGFFQSRRVGYCDEERNGHWQHLLSGECLLLDHISVAMVSGVHS